MCGVDEANALARSIGARARFAARWARPDASVAWNSSSVLLEVILVLTTKADEDGESRDADASVSGVAAAGAPHVGAFTPTEFYDRLVVLRDARDAYARNGDDAWVLGAALAPLALGLGRLRSRALLSRTAAAHRRERV